MAMNDPIEIGAKALHEFMWPQAAFHPWEEVDPMVQGPVRDKIRIAIAAIEAAGWRLMAPTIDDAIYDAIRSQLRAGEGPSDIYEAALAATSTYGDRNG